MDTDGRIESMTSSPPFATNVSANARLFRAPGRVNIIGEHTDYNDGFVLPTNTALYTWVAVMPRPDRVISVSSANFEERRHFNIDDIEPSNRPEWIDYIKGVCAEIESAGITLCGADIEIQGDIPLGGGLSSSASLELAVATALLANSGGTLLPRELAGLCQRAEHAYAGVNCGIMDQFSIACCDDGAAIFLDCRSLEIKSVVLPDNISLLVTDSGVKHQLSKGDYNQRAIECQQAVAILQANNPEISSLRDVSTQQPHDAACLLGECLFRRSTHVVTEIERTIAAYESLVSGDIEELGKLVQASHASLRDDFEVSCDDIESPVAVANSCDGVLGSRMVGAGFGGCVLSIVHTPQIELVEHQIASRYRTPNGKAPWLHTVVPTHPAEEWQTT